MQTSNVTKLIEKYGKLVTLTTDTAKEFDPITGTFNSGVEVNNQVYAHFSRFNNDVEDVVTKGMIKVLIKGDIDIYKFNKIDGKAIIKAYPFYVNDVVAYYEVALNG